MSRSGFRARVSHLTFSSARTCRFRLKKGCHHQKSESQGKDKRGKMATLNPWSETISQPICTCKTSDADQVEAEAKWALCFRVREWAPPQRCLHVRYLGSHPIVSHGQASGCVPVTGATSYYIKQRRRNFSFAFNFCLSAPQGTFILCSHYEVTMLRIFRGGQLTMRRVPTSSMPFGGSSAETIHDPGTGGR